eukprot:834759-Pyramimonas_sp.AAC.1
MRAGRPATLTFHLGSLSSPCPHCGALLFPCETDTFCCNGGAYIVDFDDFFKAPDKPLLDIYASTWPLTDKGGCSLHDAKTNAPALTGFTAASRKYNALFALAQHEIQSSTAEKELRFGDARKPSNIRIHGTMYRRVFTCTDQVPLRYLVIDPRERLAAAAQHGLPRHMVQRLERLIVPRNEHMALIRRLSEKSSATPNADIVLEWHEGVDEVAGIVDFHHDPNKKPRAVVFHLKAAEKPTYLHPLSPLYEPLSYPLWYPFGGRGWSVDVLSTTGRKVTQMWWYRQQVLRLSHMHMCGRLLNDWLIN